MKQKLIIVDCNLKIGGIQKALIDLLKQIHNDFDVTLLLLNPIGSLIREVPSDVHLISTRSDFCFMGMAQADCKSIWAKLRRAFYVVLAKAFGQETSVKIAGWSLRRDRDLMDEVFDVAVSYSHMAPERSFFGGTAQYVLKACRAKEKVCYIHCDYRDSGNASDYSNRVYKQFDRIICVSESTRKRFVEVVPDMQEKVIAKYNPIDSEMIRRKAHDHPYEYDSGYTNLLTVARLTSEKGVDRFIRVLSRVGNQRFRYYVVGSGIGQSSIENEISELKLQDRVFMLGETENPYRYMLKADMLVVPSYHEAAPVVFQEAKALGLKVLTTRTTSADEMIGTQFGDVVDNTDDALFEYLNRYEDINCESRE